MATPMFAAFKAGAPFTPSNFKAAIAGKKKYNFVTNNKMPGYHNLRATSPALFFGGAFAKSYSMFSIIKCSW